ncbi:MAG: DUF1697 domain-containing protein [Nitrososphaerota archaeon]|jgi:uncharacterized protein (DUF1697 family)|nr:DUF1697 domain-containing protein [Nitrososphaerota archaeon]
MQTYIALLRGINVGGNNKIAMPELKKAFEDHGFTNVSTYINSGNVIFNSDFDEPTVQSACEALIEFEFGLKITVGIISAEELRDALAHAPNWWNNDPESKHNAIFVIPPMTAQEVFAIVGEIKIEYEKQVYHGKVIFWSAQIATFSHTRWTKMVHHESIRNVVTVRNANTALKLAALTGEIK